MEPVLIAPAKVTLLGIPGMVFALIIPIVGVCLFTYIIAQRSKPMVLAAPDARFDHIGARLLNVLKICDLIQAGFSGMRNRCYIFR